MSDEVIFCRSLAEAFGRAGLPFPDKELLPDKLVRFSTNGKPSDTAGWCRLFADGLGAVFGCHRSGISCVWQMRDEGIPSLTDVERQAMRARTELLRQQAEQERTAAQAKAAQEAVRIHHSTAEAKADLAYVRNKGIKPYHARQSQDGSIILPVSNASGEVQSLQFIDPDGKKRFLYQGKMQAGRLYLGTPSDGSPLIITEGWATGCSIHEATGKTVAVAFSGANLTAVCADLRLCLPHSLLVVAGDRDANGKGAEYARAAVAATGEKTIVVFPEFNDARTAGDFNDLHQSEGMEAVRIQLDAAMSKLVELPITFAPPATPGCDARDGTADTRPLTEYGNAARMFDAHGRCLRYVYDAKQWLEWTNGAWRWDIGGATVRRFAAALPSAIYAEGARHLAQANYFSRWARASQQHRVIIATAALLSDFDQIRLPLSNIDADPFLVGIDHARQVIDLRTGIVRLANERDYITKSLNSPDLGEERKAVRWLAFLHQVFEGDEELIDWLHRWCGYMLTGSTVEQFFIFAYGLGANGKSIFAETIKYIAGDYARAIASETLTESKRQAGSATPDLAALIGARLALSTETEEGAALAETLVKALVSGDSMSVRQLYSGPVQFTPAFKLLILGNHKPVIRGNDHGIWRRVRLIPFKKTFSPKERDPHLLTKLKLEAPHILAWMVRGCMKWHERGLCDLPEAIRTATDEYKQDQDVVGEWLAQCCTLSTGCETEGPELYQCYRQWSLNNGLTPASNLKLGRRLTERGLKVRQSNGRRFWGGIALKSAQQADYAARKWGS